MAVETLQTAVPLTQRRFTVAEYDQMIEAGILTEDERIELIEGMIAEMSPIGVRHARCIRRLIALLSSHIGQSAILDIQNPIHVSDYSEPQPDAVLLKPNAEYYTGHPTPADVLLLIEVADTSLEYDRAVKTPLYALAMIPEVWVVSLADETVNVYTEPADGVYRTIRTLKRGDTLTSTILPAVTFSVEQLFV
jgi:Uma2 family endonuclease